MIQHIGGARRNVRRRKRVGLGWVVSWLLWNLVPLCASARAQAPEQAGAALSRCDVAAQAQDGTAAGAAAADAEQVAAALGAGYEADALVIRAQILTRCRIPFAGFMQQGALVEESNQLLERALALAPHHLGAQFTLGMNHYHTPEFLGRTGAAVAAFERVLADHGEEDDERVAAAYYYLGVLYERMGRSGEATTTWRKGAKRFPQYEPLQKKVVGIGASVETQDSAHRETAGVGISKEERPIPEYRIEPIIVEASGYSMEDPRTATRLTKLDVYTLPGGTADVLQTFKTMPGVTQVTDGSDLYVRGGDPAESPIFVDGARLFYPGKFETLDGSMFGVLDPSTLQRAYFSVGGFSARYGNALSGVVDIQTEGRPAEQRFRVGANITSLGVTAWQPVGANAGAWATASVTETAALLALHGRQHKYPRAPSSYQGMAGAVLQPARAVEVKASALVESDETVVRIRALGYEGPFTSTATTRLTTASVRLINGTGTAGLRFSVGGTVRDGGFTFGVLDRDALDRAVTARLDAELTRGPLQLRSGVELAALEAVLDGLVPAGEALIPGSPAIRLHQDRRAARHVGGYTEVEAQIVGDMALIAGLRADALPGEDRLTLDPRLAAAYRLGDWTLRLGGGVFSQGRWRARIDVPNGGLPNGIPLRARHLVAGVQRRGALSFRAEAYLKDYDDYRPDPDGAGPLVVDGRATGLDVLLQWIGTQRLSGWLTYSLLRGRLAFGDGSTTPSSYDVTHTLAGVSKVAMGRWWELGLTARYATGRPYTAILGATDPTGDKPLAPEYGPLLAERYPDYWRLDARLTRFLPVRGRSVIIYLEALNVLDHVNVMGYTYDGLYRNPRPVESFFADRTLVLGAEATF